MHSNRHDIIHIHTPFVAYYAGIWLSKRLQIPVVESYHTFFEECLYHYIPFIPKPWLKLLARKFSVSQCRQVNHIVVLSKPTLKVLLDYGVDSTFTIIPTDVNLKKTK